VGWDGLRCVLRRREGLLGLGSATVITYKYQIFDSYAWEFGGEGRMALTYRP
jgi:hypothetical protein